MREFPHNPNHAHGLATTAGYAVRRTNLATCDPDLGDAVEFAPDYGVALDAARTERAKGDGAWAVIDWVYTCGCRSMG